MSLIRKKKRENTLFLVRTFRSCFWKCSQWGYLHVQQVFPNTFTHFCVKPVDTPMYQQCNSRPLSSTLCLQLSTALAFINSSQEARSLLILYFYFYLPTPPCINTETSPFLVPPTLPPTERLHGEVMQFKATSMPNTQNRFGEGKAFNMKKEVKQPLESKIWINM